MIWVWVGVICWLVAALPAGLIIGRYISGRPPRKEPHDGYTAHDR
jgi:uncharacterized protein YneF (UPF0154 family)